MDEATLPRLDCLMYGGSLIADIMCLAVMVFFIAGRVLRTLPLSGNPARVPLVAGVVRSRGRFIGPFELEEL
jgi:hypothetical protein